MTNINKTIGRRIKNLRKERGLNQTEFGKMFNMSQNDITNIENGKKTISFDALLNIAEKFEVSTDYIIKENSEKGNNPTLQYICDYTNLSSEAIEKLHNAPEKPLSKNPAYSSLIPEMKNSEFFSLYKGNCKKVQGAILNDDYIYKLISSTAFCMTVSDYYRHIDNAQGLKREIDLELFTASNSVVDYIKSKCDYESIARS